jgi:putative heme-binding domain-containing protein
MLSGFPRAAILLSLLLGLAGAGLAQPKAASNPSTSDEDIAVGRQFYLGHCAQCHGHDAEGGRGVSLTTGRFKHGESDAELFVTIQKGIRGTEMPRSRLPEPDLWKLIAYLRSLTRQGGSERAAGDVTAGAVIYNGTGGCANCHVVNGKGSGLGPDLSNIGLRRSLVFLRESLTDPNAYIPQEYPSASTITNDGRRVQGILLNEDDYTLQIRDMGENLHSLTKSNLKSFQRDEDSLMPAYGSTLSAQEVDDLVAYLSSLRGKP